MNLVDIDVTTGAQKTVEMCRRHLDSITDTDERERQLGTLNQCLDTLRRLGGAKLYYDFAPLSFMFEAGGFKGGLIHHESNWSLHT